MINYRNEFLAAEEGKIDSLTTCTMCWKLRGGNVTLSTIDLPLQPTPSTIVDFITPPPVAVSR